MSDMEQLQYLIKSVNARYFNGWTAGRYGDSFTCPHGHEIELDGECPEGCVSPMRELGLI